MEDDKKLIRYKWMFYIIMLFVISVLENSTPISKIDILGGSPSLILFTISVISMFEGAAGGAGIGFAGGLFMDAMSTADGFYTITYAVCGTVIALLNTIAYRKSYVVSILLWITAVVLTASLYYVFFVLIMGKGAPSLIMQIIPGEIFATLVFTPVIYLICRYLYRRFSPDEG